MTAFATWLDTFLTEKGIDLEATMDVVGKSGLNIIPVGVLVDHIKAAPEHEQAAIKTTIVRIDFLNGDVLHFFKHIAQAIAL